MFMLYISQISGRDTDIHKQMSFLKRFPYTEKLHAFSKSKSHLASSEIAGYQK